MVFFTCNACGSALKKNQVEKHYQCECPRCEVLSCMDCGRDFYGDEYTTHTKCVSEAEKYQGGLYKESGKEGGAGKGEKKQQEWLERVQCLVVEGAKVNPKISRLLERISHYPNIPRKRSKFENFVKNSVNVCDQQTLEELWKIFSSAIKPVATDVTVKTSSSVSTGAATCTVSSDGETCNTKKEKKKKRYNPVVEDNQMPGSRSEATSMEHRESKAKRKKHKCEKGDEITETGATEVLQELDTSLHAEETVASSHNTKKKKKLIKHNPEPIACDSDANEAHEAHVDSESRGRKNAVTTLSHELDAELAPPKKKKRKKMKKQDCNIDNDFISTEVGGSSGSVGPVEVALEYINGHHHLGDEDVEADVHKSSSEKSTKKGDRKGNCKRVGDTVTVAVERKKSKKHKKHNCQQ